MKSTLLSKLALSLLLFVGASLFQGCQKDNPVNEPPVETQKISAALPQQWMDMAYNTVKRQGMFALDASRLYAYAAITAYESLVHAVPNGRSLAGQLHGLNTLPQPETGKTYDYGIVLCHAMPQVFEAIVPNMNIAADQAMDELAVRQERSLTEANNLNQQVINDSKAYADALAKAIIDWSNTDNRRDMDKLKYTPPSLVGNPQYWDGSTLGQNFMMPFWWTSRPFVIPSYKICEPEAPYEYSEAPNSAYYKDVREVYDASFDPAKVEIGRYWANNPGVSGSPAGSWIAIANQLVDQYSLDMPTTIRMYVLLAIGTRDGFIACWYMKYKYNLQRPVTYIRNVIGDKNWNSPVPTPPYPDYTSGTSTNAGVSSEILTRLFGFRSFTDSQHTDKGYGVRTFNHFKEAGVQAFHSRIYGGVHMRRACELGYEHGQCMADYIFKTLKFTR